MVVDTIATQIFYSFVIFLGFVSGILLCCDYHRHERESVEEISNPRSNPRLDNDSPPPPTYNEPSLIPPPYSSVKEI